MVRRIDLNADMGEGVGDDAALLDIVTSANVACGFHAGGPDVMAHTMKEGAKRGVGLGAHPGFDDLEGFGRKRQTVPTEQLENLVAYQVAAAQGMARACGGQQLRHVKLHGALANMASEDADLASTCFRAALSVDPELTMVVIAATAQQQVAERLGCKFACEIFADRAYNDDATLVDRSLPGAVIHDAAEAARRVGDMVRAGGIIAQSGKVIETKIDTICVHGDTAEALDIARAVRAGLEASSINVARF